MKDQRRKDLIPSGTTSHSNNIRGRNPLDNERGETMKLNKTNTKVTEYTVSYDSSDYFITITETETVYTAWIREKNQGIQMHMLGLLKKDVTKKQFIEIITDRLEDEIESYNDRVEIIEETIESEFNAID